MEPFKTACYSRAALQFDFRSPGQPRTIPRMVSETYTVEEVAQRNYKGGSDCWLIYKGAVYNVTEYVKNDEHPGGSDLVTDWAGMDCTKAFNDAGHSAEAMRDLKKYKIGTLATSANTNANSADKSNTAGSAKAAEAQSNGQQQKYKKRPCFLFC